ncbi:MAG TPA: hypothetical protein VMH28_00565 [Candidatus Acidoferrales bacterium]|nr:hypothetical protein [Candidatus Acidoferrales bacterium]
MKTTMKQLMVAAAVLALAAGAATAQTLKAEIPFSFTAGGKVMAPGSYDVRLKDVDNLVTLSNFEARQSAMLLPGGRSTPAKEWRAKGDPVLVFECGAGRCSLIRLWAGGGNMALSIPHHNPGREEQASLTLIPMTRAAD